MPFCPECGKRVAPTAKFCRNCGASQAEETVPSQKPAAGLPGTLVCRSCGTPVLPDEKFCGSCGAKAGGAPVPPPAPVMQSPPPVQAPVCPSCRAPLDPGTRFCGACGQAVNSGSAVPVPQPSPVPAIPVAPVSAGIRTCRSCGNVIRPGDRFCSKCLAIVSDSVPVPPPPPAQASAVPAGKFCGSCGTPVSATTKFCGGCGAPVGASFPAGPVVPVPSPVSSYPPGGERVIGVIGNVRKMKMLGASWDTFSLVITDRRMIFANLTRERLDAAIAEAQQMAKAEGKGFLETWGDQLTAGFRYAKRYETISPDAALAETPGNTAIDNSSVRSIDLKLVTEKGNVQYGEFRMAISALNGNSEYRIGEDDRYISILRTAYGDKVHLPSGYVRAGGVRIRFF